MTAIGSNAGNGSAGDMTVDPTAADRPTGERGYSGRRTAEIVGITYRQLDYWARTDLIRPSLADAPGSGSRRRYSYRDLLELKVIKTPARRRASSSSRCAQVFDLPARAAGRGHHLGQPRDQRQRRRCWCASGEELIDVLAAGPGRAQRAAARRGQGRDRRQRSSSCVPAGRRRWPTEAALRGRPSRRRRAPSDRRDATSPLDAVHRALGAKMVPFGGWDMPLSYADGHARRAPGLPRPAPWPSTSATSAPCGSRARRPRPAAGGAHQRPRPRSARAGPSTPTCSTPADASVLDDIIVWWVDDRASST